MNPALDDIGKLILRVTLGLLVLLHGYAKLLNGIDGIIGMMQGIGLPGFLAYGVFIGEVVGPVLLILGFYARIGAGLIGLNMVVAIALVHANEIFALTDTGGWAIELQGMYLFSALALAFMGPGRLSVNRR
jgi:putative oxidoreductase